MNSIIFVKILLMLTIYIDTNTVTLLLQIVKPVLRGHLWDKENVVF
jgi:hypothetical protein